MTDEVVRSRWWTLQHTPSGTLLTFTRLAALSGRFNAALGAGFAITTGLALALGGFSVWIGWATVIVGLVGLLVLALFPVSRQQWKFTQRRAERLDQALAIEQVSEVSLKVFDDGVGRLTIVGGTERQLGPSGLPPDVQRVLGHLAANAMAVPLAANRAKS